MGSLIRSSCRQALDPLNVGNRSSWELEDWSGWYQAHWRHSDVMQWLCLAVVSPHVQVTVTWHIEPSWQHYHNYLDSLAVTASRRTSPYFVCCVKLYTSIYVATICVYSVYGTSLQVHFQISFTGCNREIMWVAVHGEIYISSHYYSAVKDEKQWI